MKKIDSSADGFAFATAFPLRAAEVGMTLDLVREAIAYRVFLLAVPLQLLPLAQRRLVLNVSPQQSVRLTPEQWAILSKTTARRYVRSLEAQALSEIPIELVFEHAVPRKLLAFLSYPVSRSITINLLATLVRLGLEPSSFWSKVEDELQKPSSGDDLAVSLLMADMLFINRFNETDLWQSAPPNTVARCLDRIYTFKSAWFYSNGSALMVYGYDVEKYLIPSPEKLLEAFTSAKRFAQGPNWRRISPTDIELMTVDQQKELVEIDWRIISKIKNPAQEVIDTAVGLNKYAALILQTGETK